MTPAALQTKALYKALLKQAGLFASYNYRRYAQERVRIGFKENKGVSDAATIAKLLTRGQEDLQLLKRQTTINRMYTNDKLVMEP